MSGALLIGVLVAGVTSTAAGDDQPDEPRLALDGYDPVAYFTMGAPVRGVVDFRYVVDGVDYLFANADHLSMFRDEPDRYLPQFGGLCAMGLAANGYSVVADPHNWVIQDGRLYIMQRSFGPPGFRTDPEGFISAAEQNLALLEGMPIGSGISWW